METATPTKAEMRVEIARDVLKLLKAKKIQPAHTYFEASKIDVYCPDAVSPTADLKKLLPKLGTCDVCAIGGLLYAYIKRHDRTKAKDLTCRGDIVRVLGRVFPQKQLNEIEAAYEGGVRSASLAALEFRRGWYWSDREAMAAIMQNIVDNGGTFRP